MEKYNGKIIYRIRPKKENFISETKELPYEIHFMSFDSKQDLNNFMKDDCKQNFIHLKNESVSSTLIVLGEKI